MDLILQFFERYVAELSLPSLTIIDIVEMLIIAFAIYQLIMWVKNTRAWMLVKGLVFLLVFSLIAMVLQMDVILWIFKNAISVGIIAIIIVFQPELRSALEQLGRKNVIKNLFVFDDDKNDVKYSKETINALCKACAEMSKAKTGALIVLENDIMLKDIEKTGIRINSDVSSQLICNIFEHNTPLHDGAVILRDNRIIAATCYLPLSDNLELSKELGTRHRAAVGVSEVSDSLTIIVSEETGAISIAKDGVLTRSVDTNMIKKRINQLMGIDENQNTKRNFLHKKERRKKKHGKK